MQKKFHIPVPRVGTPPFGNDRSERSPDPNHDPKKAKHEKDKHRLFPQRVRVRASLQPCLQKGTNLLSIAWVFARGVVDAIHHRALVPQPVVQSEQRTFEIGVKVIKVGVSNGNQTFVTRAFVPIFEQKDGADGFPPLANLEIETFDHGGGCDVVEFAQKRRGPNSRGVRGYAVVFFSVVRVPSIGVGVR